MYAQSKVEERLQICKSELGYGLEYHSPEEVDSFNERLGREGKFLLGENQQRTGVCNLTLTDAHFIENEQALVLCDAAYFLTRYAYLKSEENIVQRFNFRVPQKLYFDIICDLESREAAIEIMILKARQLGMSIFTELLIAH